MTRLLFQSKYHSSILIFITLILASCEKVIEVPINEEEQSYVLEGVLKDRDSASFFKVSKTKATYDNNGFEVVSSAVIKVGDNNGVEYVFEEDPQMPGTYVNYNFVAEENQTYYLSAIIGGELITSSSYSKTKPVIDSLGYQVVSYGQGAQQESFLLPEYYSKDPVDEQNNYRLRIWVNGEEENEYYIGNDYYINGQVYDAQFFGADAEFGDTIFVEMLEMDEKVYDYIYGLSNTLSTGAFSPSPANPPSNLEGNAIGYFAVFMTDTMSMIIQ
ncbi:MAG: hypothetical protein WDZ35_12435 [Crocinitomicaceae bacterium]